MFLWSRIFRRLSPKEQRIIEVEWERALPLVQHLMEEMPDIYPPRYLVRRFPDEGTLAALEKIGTRHEGKPS
jgi:hypothetical protein